jgi:hypothetical protein
MILLFIKLIFTRSNLLIMLYFYRKIKQTYTDVEYRLIICLNNPIFLNR